LYKNLKYTVILMTPNALFDRGRMRDVRKAIAEGKPLPSCKGKQPLAEPPLPAVSESRWNREELLTPGVHVTASFNPNRSQEENRATKNLFIGIKEGNILRVSVAIERGADINSAGCRMVVTDPRNCMIGIPITPLQYAREENQLDIAQFLVTKGAKE
jgi:hypothetical protein